MTKFDTQGGVRARHVGRLACFALLIAGLTGCAAPAQWLRWGGPHGNFMVESRGLASAWPDDGPTKLWHRELGAGYSSIVVADGVLYTMYEADEVARTVALDAQTGEAIWEQPVPSSFKGTEFGRGPSSTPLIAKDRLFVVGSDAVLYCFNRKTGALLWRHDLPAEFGAPVPMFGYSCSPIAYEGMVILPVDRKRPDAPGSEPPGEAVDPSIAQSLMAFDQQTGDVVWRSQDFPIDYSSPAMINLDGEDQLVLLMRKFIMGVDPNSGELLWQHEVLPVPEENIATPLWTGDDLLFLSAAYSSGSRVIKLTKSGEQTVPEELWYSRKLRILQANAIRIGDYVYGTSGDFGSVFLVCMNIKTGDVVWRERGFKKATCVYADGKVILLDEDGLLVLATVSPEGITTLSKSRVAEHRSWTPPTLVGKTLYVRDQKRIMALDLG